MVASKEFGLADTSYRTIDERQTQSSVAIPDEQTFVVRTLINDDIPHFSWKFIIPGCPRGLELLDLHENLVVNRRLQNFIDLEADRLQWAYSQFDIKSSDEMQLYIAVEKVNKHSLKLVRDARPFEVTFYDFHYRKVFTVKRRSGPSFLFAQYLCLFFTYGFKGCGNIADVVMDSDGQKLGSIKQKLSFSSTILHIHNQEGKCVIIIEGVFADGILDVTTPGHDEPIAIIETLLTETEALDFYKVTVPRCSSPYGITFIKETVTPEHKALLLAAVILLEFIHLKPNSDYPHLAEVIPDDFQEFPLPQSKLYRDGSRELIILTEKRKRNRKKNSKLKGRWGCCIWCGQLLCLCWLLGCRRNAIRCSCLVLLIIGLIAAIVIFVKFYFLHANNSEHA